jgi:hypothetical protein
VRKTDGNVDQLKELVIENRRITIFEVADMFEVSFSSVQSILKVSLNMHQIATKYKTHLVSEEQKENKINTCQDSREA